ncbi:hypothetical protein DFH09DRAFT_1284426 [Mycena vulgaris]|nr:hypothetical protein DFH09DRAFT_1284426 [Mycena vulgaris]
MWLRLLYLVALFALVCAQGDDTLSVSTEQALTGFANFEFLWKGEAGHNLNNITLELVQGSAEDNGNNVMDIMITNVSSLDTTQAVYTIHPGVPAGTYHARVNGTIYNGDTVLSSTSTLSTLSNTFSILDAGVPCSAGTFTPITSLQDPAYRPVRFTAPIGAQVFTLASITGPSASLSITFGNVDVLFNAIEVPATMEVINTITGFNAGVQHTNSIFFALGGQYITSNITLDPGSWKARVNFTVFSPANYPGKFTMESEEFFIVPDSNSTPNCTASTTSGASPSGAGSGTGPTQSNVPSGSVPTQSSQPSAPAASSTNPFQTPSSKNGAALVRDRKNLVQSGWTCVAVWVAVLVTVGQLYIVI